MTTAGPASRRLLAAGVLCGAALLASPARAADPQALFDQGVAAMEAGRFDAACPAIEQSYTIDPLPGTLFTLAECEAKRGRLATALRRYDDYLASYGALSPERKAKQGDREKICRAQREALRDRVPELTLALPPNVPPGTEVTRDGVKLDKLDLGVPLRVDPGEHVITTRAPGRPTSTTKVTLAVGDRRGIALVVLEPAAPVVPVAVVRGAGTAPDARNEAPANWRLPVGIAGVAAGAVLLGTGVFATTQVIGVNDDASFVAFRTQNPTSSNVCPLAASGGTPLATSVSSLCSKAKTFEAVEGAVYPLAAVLVGAGIYLLATQRPTARTQGTNLVVLPALAPGYAGGSAALRF